MSAPSGSWRSSRYNPGDDWWIYLLAGAIAIGSAAGLLVAVAVALSAWFTGDGWSIADTGKWP